MKKQLNMIDEVQYDLARFTTEMKSLPFKQSVLNFAVQLINNQSSQVLDLSISDMTLEFEFPDEIVTTLLPIRRGRYSIDSLFQDITHLIYEKMTRIVPEKREHHNLPKDLYRGVLSITYIYMAGDDEVIQTGHDPLNRRIRKTDMKMFEIYFTNDKRVLDAYDHVRFLREL